MYNLPFINTLPLKANGELDLEAMNERLKAATERLSKAFEEDYGPFPEMTHCRFCGHKLQPTEKE
jgi:hypothetical protein